MHMHAVSPRRLPKEEKIWNLARQISQMWMAFFESIQTVIFEDVWLCSRRTISTRRHGSPATALVRGISRGTDSSHELYVRMCHLLKRERNSSQTSPKHNSINEQKSDDEAKTCCSLFETEETQYDRQGSYKDSIILGHVLQPSSQAQPCSKH